MNSITFSDGSETNTVNVDDLVGVSFDEDEFSNSAEATWYLVETSDSVLVAEMSETSDDDWRHLQSIADSDYLASDATDEF